MTKVISLLGIASLILATALCGPAVAQRMGGGGMQRGGMMGRSSSSPLDLLQNAQVQKELELVDDQKAELREIGEQLRDKFRSMMSGLEDVSREERVRKIQEMRQKMEGETEGLRNKIKEVLLPHQTERLQQIFVRVQGTQALSSPDIAKTLKLSNDQKKRIEQTRLSLRDEMRGMFTNMQDLDAEQRRAQMTEMRAKMEKLRAGIDKKVLAVLSVAQRSQFEEMKGEPFELDRSAMMGRGRGRGPQAGAGQGGARQGGAGQGGGRRQRGARQGGGGRFGGGDR